MKEKKNTEKSLFSTLKDYNFLLKMFIAATPLYVVLITLDAARGSLSIFLEHTVGIGYILSAAERGEKYSKVFSLLMFLIAFITLGLIFDLVVQHFYAQKMQPLLRKKIKMRIYEKAKDVDMLSYDESSYYDDYRLCVSEFDNQLDRVINVLQNFFSCIVTFLLTGSYFLINDAGACFFVALSFVLRTVFGKKYNKMSFDIKLEKNVLERKREYYKRLFYLGDYAKEVRFYRKMTNSFVKEFKDISGDIYSVEKKYMKKRFLLHFLHTYISTDFISSVLMVLYLLYKVIVVKSLSVSGFAVLYACFGTLRNSLTTFTDLYADLVETRLYSQKLRKFLNREPEISSGENISIGNEPKRVLAENISFAYKNGPQVLNDISFDIKPKEKIAIVGYNGAGKTSLVKAILRLYDVNNGKIMVDDIDIKDYNVDAYRKSVGTVFQDFSIFPISVGENVKMDLVDNSDSEAIEHALDLAGMNNRVGVMSKGIGTVVSKELVEDGVDLSGGEAQKIAISRVLLKRKGLIILDEPSSALDPISEYEINQAMLKTSEVNTVIFISHRLSTTRFADRILFMEAGRIVEQGSHEELLKLNGRYARMWEKQAEPYLDSANLMAAYQQ